MTTVRGVRAAVCDEPWLAFGKRRDGMIHALDGGMWFHRHVFKGERMAHVVSSDKPRLLCTGLRIGLKAEWLQYKALRDPRTGARLDAWHWDLRGWSLESGERIVESSTIDDGEADR